MVIVVIGAVSLSGHLHTKKKSSQYVILLVVVIWAKTIGAVIGTILMKTNKRI